MSNTSLIHTLRSTEHHFAANYEKNKPQEGWHIGDLGSGLGNSTFDLACNAPESCKVTGIDCSPIFVEFVSKLRHSS